MNNYNSNNQTQRSGKNSDECLKLYRRKYYLKNRNRIIEQRKIRERKYRSKSNFNWDQKRYMVEFLAYKNTYPTKQEYDEVMKCVLGLCTNEPKKVENISGDQTKVLLFSIKRFFAEKRNYIRLNYKAGKQLAQMLGVTLPWGEKRFFDSMLNETQSIVDSKIDQVFPSASFQFEPLNYILEKAKSFDDNEHKKVNTIKDDLWDLLPPKPPIQSADYSDIIDINDKKFFGAQNLYEGRQEILPPSLAIVTEHPKNHESVENA